MQGEWSDVYVRMVAERGRVHRKRKAKKGFSHFKLMLF